MKSPADYWSGLLTFARVVEHGSFVGAARAAGMTPSAVSKAVSRLEQRLGVRLVKRSTRKLGLTQDGVAFYERISPALKTLDEAEDHVQTARAPHGLLRVTAPIDLGRTLIASWIGSFAGEYPQLRVELNVTDRLVDLTREGYDLAIRMGVPEDSRLTMRSLGRIHYAVVASPAYVDGHGRPETPSRLQEHACLRFLTVAGQPMPWAFDGWDPVWPEGPLDTDDGGALRMAALHGAGIAYLIRFAVEQDIANGSLIELLPDLQKPGIQVYAIHAFRDKLPARARVFLEFLHARLSPDVHGGR